MVTLPLHWSIYQVETYFTMCIIGFFMYKKWILAIDILIFIINIFLLDMNTYINKISFWNLQKQLCIVHHQFTLGMIHYIKQ